MSSRCFSDKIKARHFYSKKCFIGNFCTINDGGVFGRKICEIYPKEVKIKIEQQGYHSKFSSLDRSTEEGAFIYIQVIS